MMVHSRQNLFILRKEKIILLLREFGVNEKQVRKWRNAEVKKGWLSTKLFGESDDEEFDGF